MEIEKNRQINTQHVGELISKIRNLQTTAGRFRLKMTPQKAFDKLAFYYAKEVHRRNKEIIFDDQTINNLVAMAQYITDPKSKIGIMLCGTCGNGKTTMVMALRDLIYECSNKGEFDYLKSAGGNNAYFEVYLRFEDARDILEIYKDRKRYSELRSERLLAIDDLGKEPAEVLEYGNVTNPLIDLLEHRYLAQLFTAITTNLDGKQIREKYGGRIADRFNEMLEVIVFQDISYRK